MAGPKYQQHHSTDTHQAHTDHGDGTRSEHYSITENHSVTPVVESEADLGSLHSSQDRQPSPAISEYDQAGNTAGAYQAGCNGNYNSGLAAQARYPRMTREIGGTGPEEYGEDRIQVEHDSLLLHRR